jgi:hypothetical protein
MAQKMLFCFTNISVQILLHILYRSFCTERHILANVCQNGAVIKASKIICTIADLLLRQKCG